jgi:hypothetical protein
MPTFKACVFARGRSARCVSASSAAVSRRFDEERFRGCPARRLSGSGAARTNAEDRGRIFEDLATANDDESVGGTTSAAPANAPGATAAATSAWRPPRNGQVDLENTAAVRTVWTIAQSLGQALDRPPIATDTPGCTFGASSARGAVTAADRSDAGALDSNGARANNQDTNRRATTTPGAPALSSLAAATARTWVRRDDCIDGQAISVVRHALARNVDGAALRPWRRARGAIRARRPHSTRRAVTGTEAVCRKDSRRGLGPSRERGARAPIRAGSTHASARNRACLRRLRRGDTAHAAAGRDDFDEPEAKRGRALDQHANGTCAARVCRRCPQRRGRECQRLEP